jgi:hypothetical protein
MQGVGPALVPQINQEFDQVELHPQGWTRYFVDQFSVANLPTLKYFILKISYDDSIGSETYSDSFIRKWNGNDFVLLSIVDDAELRDKPEVKSFLN